MPNSDHDAKVRQWLLWLLGGGGAHAKFDEVVENLPAELRGKKPRGLPFSVWQLLEHMRLAQEDILEFSINPEYKEREWPADYWPKSPKPADDSAWERSVRAFRADSRRMQNVIADAKNDLHAVIPWGNGQTLLREALLVADHNAYHLGEIVLVRRLLKAWGR
jgi:uncharacterized damage-inducible protein DinB